jgi:hypothetical protein
MQNGSSNAPVDIIDKLLARGQEVARKTARLAADFAAARTTVRGTLMEQGKIFEVADAALETVEMPGICAVDGGLICDSKAIGDICTAVAVSVGPAEQSESEVFMESVARSTRNKEVLTGIMCSMEIMLAAKSRADVVMIDGSLLSALINISKAVHWARKPSNEMEERALAIVCAETRDAVMEILTSTRHVAMPKYTTSGLEFDGVVPEVFKSYDGRTIATMALKAGETTAMFTKDRQIALSDQKSLIGNALKFDDVTYTRFQEAVAGVTYAYYRPHPWTTAFRFDIPSELRDDGEALLKVMRAIRDTTGSAGIREPLPLYLVDNFAKQISVGASPVMDMITLESIEDDDARMLLAMGHRT